MIKLFVWGTLRQKHINHFILSLDRARFVKRLEHERFGDGEVYEVRKLKWIDYFERLAGYKPTTWTTNGEELVVYEPNPQHFKNPEEEIKRIKRMKGKRD